MASNGAVTNLSLASSSLSKLRTQWGVFQGELQGVMDKLEKAEEGLSTIVQGVFTSAAQKEWDEAVTTAEALIDRKVEVSSQILPMDSKERGLIPVSTISAATVDPAGSADPAGSTGPEAPTDFGPQAEDQLTESVGAMVLLHASNQALIEVAISPSSSPWYQVLSQELGEVENLVVAWRRNGFLYFEQDILQQVIACGDGFLEAKAGVDLLFQQLQSDFSDQLKQQIAPEAERLGTAGAVHGGPARRLHRQAPDLPGRP